MKKSLKSKKLICIFIMTLCVSSGEALAEQSVLNKHDLFLNNSDIPKTHTTPNQEALDKLNKSLQQEAANSYKDYKNKEALDQANKDFKRLQQESEKNYPNHKRNKIFQENRNDFSITIPLSK